MRGCYQLTVFFIVPRSAASRRSRRALHAQRQSMGMAVVRLDSTAQCGEGSASRVARVLGTHS